MHQENVVITNDGGKTLTIEKKDPKLCQGHFLFGNFLRANE